MSMKTLARTALQSTPLFRPARRLYQQLIDTEGRARRKQLHAIYGQFVRPGDLVFDVGANKGDYADFFLELGGRVVAMDPQPECCEILRRLAASGDIVVENVAVGSKPGTLPLHTCGISGWATVSPEWIERSKEIPSYAGTQWGSDRTVPVTTLDALAQKYGVPAFVKIDVEGFEVEVLRGMSFQPKGLSFEFHMSSLDAAEQCFKLLPPNLTEFNLILGSDGQMTFPGWVSPGMGIISWLREYRGSHEFGDILARQG